MADKKYAGAAFDYDPGRYKLDDIERAAIGANFAGEPWHIAKFSDEDFADMQEALAATHGYFEHLRNAASPKVQAAQYDLIRDAAEALQRLLEPSKVELSPRDYKTEIHKRTRQELEVAHEAAERVKYGLQFLSPVAVGKAAPDKQRRDQLSRFKLRARLADYDTFVRVLSQLPTIAETAKAAIVDTDTAGNEWKVVSERGTKHLEYLLKDLLPIADRHKKGRRYTRKEIDETERSFIAELAFRLASPPRPWNQRPPERNCPGLPGEMQPKSLGSLIAMLRRLEEPSRPPSRKQK